MRTARQVFIILADSKIQGSVQSYDAAPGILEKCHGNTDFTGNHCRALLVSALSVFTI
jgi:hypothetical protein